MVPPCLARALVFGLAPIGLALLAVGCGTTEPDPVPELGPADERIDGILINHVSPEPLVAAYFQSWSAKSAAACEALLEKPVSGQGATGFRFYLRPDDASHFPWLEDPYWDYDVEVRIVRNMTDPGFAGIELPVDDIYASYDVIAHADLGDGVEQTILDVIFQVLLGPDAGWIVETRLNFHTGPGNDGFLRVRRIDEWERFGIPRADDPPGLGRTSLGRLKASYEAESPQP